MPAKPCPDMLVMSLLRCSLVALFGKGVSVFWWELPELSCVPRRGDSLCGGMDGAEPWQEPPGTGTGCRIPGQPILIPLAWGMALGTGCPPFAPSARRVLPLITGPVGASGRDGTCFSKIIFYRESGSADVGER